MTFAEYVADMMMQRAREQEQFPPNPTGIPEQVDIPGFANYLAEQTLSPQGAVPQFAQAAMQPEQWVPKAMDLAGQGANWALYNLTPPGIMLQSSRNIMDRGIPQDISQGGDLVNDLVNMTPPGMLEGLAGKLAMGGVLGMAGRRIDASLVPWRKTLMQGEQLPSDMWLHGSELEGKLTPTGTKGSFGGALFLTQDPGFALHYAKANPEQVHAFKLKPEANGFDLSDLSQVENFVDNLIKNRRFRSELMRDDLANSPQEYRQSLIDSLYRQDIHEHTDFENEIFQNVAKKMGYHYVQTSNSSGGNSGLVILNPKQALQKYEQFIKNQEPK